MTQYDRILQHLERYGEITPAEAFSEYGIYRLAARISYLKKHGYNIKTIRKSTRNKNNARVCYAAYRLEDIENNDTKGRGDN